MEAVFQGAGTSLAGGYPANTQMGLGDFGWASAECLLSTAFLKKTNKRNLRCE